MMILDPRYNYITPADDYKLDMARQDFEQEWQWAWQREELTNAILFGVHSKPKTNDWIDFGNYDIKNQARYTGDLYHNKRIKQEELHWPMYYDEESQTMMI